MLAADRALPAERLERAERFRLQLLEDGAAEVVGTLIERFLSDHPIPLAERPTLQSFALTAERFVQQLSGAEPLDPDAAFSPFAGRWYGLWDGKRVDHYWGPLDLAPPTRAAPRLVATQTAWVGDGWGWNFLMHPPEAKQFVHREAAHAGDRNPVVAARGSVVLGYVEMLHHQDPDGDPHDIRDAFPLVGYQDGPGRLVWVTPNFVFCEEVLGAAGDARYAITGFQYEPTPELGLRIQGGGFQAVYTRSPDERPAWLRFPATICVKAAAE
ncbi:hypothetical protein Pla111_21790 [Botrimarina hoheduenensis]|uniref:Uncharacterized protein n=2 Tax=Botrimarina hoheduenensis TaxID=2528000 RepID=A0A5C5VZK6_9BACT|nr:hypothetical protein Pla111_21790 [Botrimarina hoheduenensis]